MTTKQTTRTDPLQILPLAEHPECRSAAMDIFSSSFPEEEHIFLAKIQEELPPSIRSEEWVILRESRTVGYIHLLLSGEITYLLYLAVAKDCRGKGIGGQAMDWLNRKFAAKFICFCVETPAEDLPDLEERLARIRYYERCGYCLEGSSIVHDENRLSLMYRSTAGPEDLQNALPFFFELLGIYDKDMKIL